MRPILSKKALFSDTTENFISPAEPAPYSEVTITFRAKKNNLDRVFFICQGQKNLMFKASSDSLFDYYEHRQQLDNEKITYYFEAQSGKARCYYDLITIQEELTSSRRSIIISASSPVFPHRPGQRAR